MFKVNNKNTRTTPMTPLTLNIFHTLCVSIVNFEHVIAGWSNIKSLATPTSPGTLQKEKNTVRGFLISNYIL